MTANDEYIAEILENVGLITNEQATAALTEAQRMERGVAEILSLQGVVDKLGIQKALANQFGMGTISLSGMALDEDVIEMMSSELAHRYKVVPVYRHDSVLTVALSDPLDVDTLDSLRHVLKLNVEGVVAPEDEIEAALQLHYPDRSGTLRSMLSEITEASVVDPDELNDMVLGDDEVTESDAPIVQFVSQIILEAFRSRASDIHLEPLGKNFRVRYRVDGVLHEVENPPRRLQSAILSRVKIMANMSIAEKRIPQDGRIEIKVMGRDLDLRVSTIPTNHGESIVMRILDKESVMLGLAQLGFFSDDQQKFERLITSSDGILLVTGPTGSGKTTTLYACLNQLNRPDRKLITVEDPVEYQLSGINQVHVRSDIGLTFSAALRSILRQAPNIVMIGEIRDMETAEIAVNASLTGHLVLSTLHTNDAPGAVTRLIDIGVKPFLVASSIRGIMAQRLVRTLCPDCKEEYQPTDQDFQLLGPAAPQIAESNLFRGKGCSSCSGTGYKGRKGIYEIFMVDNEVRNMIYAKSSTAELRQQARQLGMRTLREDGLRKAAAGITTLQEVFRVTMGDAD